MAVGDIILLVLLVIVSVKQNLKLTTISFTVPPPPGFSNVRAIGRFWSVWKLVLSSICCYSD